MGYKTVRRNGRDVLINTATGKEVRPGERLGNELRWLGQGITDNFTYSDKVDKRTGRRLTPKEVRKAEGKQPAAPKPAPAKNPAPTDAQLRREGYQIGDGLPSNRNNQGKPNQGRPAATSTSGGDTTSRNTGSGGTRSSTPAPKPATKPAAKPAAPAQRRVSAATANREAGNYGTSRTNNPMIDDAMKARMRQREEKAGVGPVKDGAQYSADVKSSTRGVGPVADGGKYAGNLKPSTTNTTTAKKKEDETKTMSIAERIRRRRAGLA
jgi:hypothetical protein